MVRDHGLGYIIGVYFLFQDLLGELPSRSGDLPPGRITKRQNKCGSRVRRSHIDTFLQCIICILTQAGEVAYGGKADVFLHHVRSLPVNGGDQQAHQRLDLFFRTIPVLGRESVQRQIFQSELSDRIHNLTDRNNAFLMPEATVFPLRLGPTSVPVHNNCHVPWQAILVYFLNQRHFLSY